MTKYIAIQLPATRATKEKWIVARQTAGGDAFRFIKIGEFTNDRDALRTAKALTAEHNFEYVTGADQQKETEHG